MIRRDLKLGLTRRALIGAGAAIAAMPFRFTAAQTQAGLTLKAQRIDADLGAGGGKTRLWSYDPLWPPILRAKQGQEIRARIINTLDRQITLHWFGIRGPAAAMSLAIEPGEANAVDCAFTPPDAGTFWFGPIADASRQRDMGLYGALIVEEAQPLNVPELTLLLDDIRLTDEGQPEDESFGDLHDAIAQGRMGNWFTVNGRYLPHFPGPAAGPMRLRLVNVANVRSMHVQFKGAEPLVLARDGQPLAASAAMTAQGIALAPGQRADVYLPPGPDQVTLAIDLFDDLLEVAYIDREGGVPAGPFTLPPNPLPVPAAEAAQGYNLILEGGEKGGLKSAILDGEKLDTRQLLERGFAWAINGVAGLGDEPWQRFKLGDTVTFLAANNTRFEQPICIHGHVWRPVEGGDWSDTAVIPPQAGLRLQFVASNPGAWGIHSTIAERMDSGLISSFVVE